MNILFSTENCLVYIFPQLYRKAPHASHGHPFLQALTTPFLEKTNHFHCVQIKSTGHPRQPPLGFGGIRPSAE